MVGFFVADRIDARAYFRDTFLSVLSPQSHEGGSDGILFNRTSCACRSSRALHSRPCGRESARMAAQAGNDTDREVAALFVAKLYDDKRIEKNVSTESSLNNSKWKTNRRHEQY